MQALREGAIGIVPSGALGVALFFHLTGRLHRNDGSVFFMERRGSRSAASLRSGDLVIQHNGISHRLAAEVMRGDLLRAADDGSIPELLLACPNPDQLTAILGEVVELIERCHETRCLDEITKHLPIVVLSSNGIYYQRQRQLFIERLEESTLLGRLPDLWPDIMPRIVGRLLRGVTMQTGVRDGSGPGAVYHPGPAGVTRLAGGDGPARHRAIAILKQRCDGFEIAENSSATRLEFDKAMVNLISNLVGQISAIDDEGRFTPLRVEQILTPGNEQRVRELIHRVVEVGRAVRAYNGSESMESIYERTLRTTHQSDGHIPSSLQWVALRLQQRKLEPDLTPTEKWLLEPLIRYAHAAGLDDSAGFFEALRDELIGKLRRAAARQ